MDSIVFIADFLWGDIVFDCLGLDCRAVLIRTADIQRVDITHFTVPGEDIRTEYGPDNISQMRNIVLSWDRHTTLVLLCLGRYIFLPSQSLTKIPDRRFCPEGTPLGSAPGT